MTISANSAKRRGFSDRLNAFTLIELLVVISIIGLLVAVATVSFSSSQKQARDIKRKSDLKFYQNGAEVFANKSTGLYPMWSAGVDASGNQFCGGSLSMSNCPQDPRSKDGNYYHYQSDGSYNDGRAMASKYVIWSVTESPAGYWVVCSSGANFYSAAQPSLDTCP